MTDCITMIKYQGLGNDYLVLDPNKNRVQLQGKKIALMCQRGFGLGADGVLYGPVDINGKWACISTTLTEAKRRSAEMVSVFLQNTFLTMNMSKRKNLRSNFVRFY